MVTDQLARMELNQISAGTVFVLHVSNSGVGKTIMDRNDLMLHRLQLDTNDQSSLKVHACQLLTSSKACTLCNWLGRCCKNLMKRRETLPATREAPILVTVQSSKEVTQGTRFNLDHPLDIVPSLCPSLPVHCMRPNKEQSEG
jgi:hypothetical protein